MCPSRVGSGGGSEVTGCALQGWGPGGRKEVHWEAFPSGGGAWWEKVKSLSVPFRSGGRGKGGRSLECMPFRYWGLVKENEVILCAFQGVGSGEREGGLWGCAFRMGADGRKQGLWGLLLKGHGDPDPPPKPRAKVNLSL